MRIEDWGQIELDPVKRYGGKLRRLRGEMGLSQGDAAKAVGVSQQTLSKAEVGDGSEETFRALEALYGVRDSYPSAPKHPLRRREFFDGLRLSTRPGGE